jgi:hypothetical protein
MNFVRQSSSGVEEDRKMCSDIVNLLLLYPCGALHTK